MFRTWVDIFARDAGTFTFQISSSAAHVTVSKPNSTVSSPGTPDVRLFISVDWASAPAGSSTAALTIKSSDGASATVSVPLNKNSAPGDFKGSC